MDKEDLQERERKEEKVYNKGAKEWNRLYYGECISWLGRLEMGINVIIMENRLLK